MPQGTDTLTEKEKQALRLLLGGHDAKSMASHLGLSVHTINERLRDARRKLQVSSSKAAARALHAAEMPAEGMTPENLGDRFSGGATVAMAAPSSRHWPRPLPAMFVGGSAMLALFVTALALAAPQAATPPVPAAATTAATESEAARAARDWLALVDAQNWPASYAATGASFRKANTMANWQAAAQGVHARLGPALSRELLADFDTPSAADVRAVRFRTIFPGNQVKTETLSLAREGGAWRVVGIYLE